MKKIIKSCLLTTVATMVSSAAFAQAGDPNAVGVLSDFNVQIYGTAAISVFNKENNTDKNGNAQGYNYDNESRIGFRTNKDLFDNVNIFMQVESGYFGDSGASLGNRDTFIGVQGDWGKIRFGRMLTPLYQIVDWPYSNPGLGRVFDSGGDVVANYDRQSQMARYDSPDFAGFTYSVSLGRGNTKTPGKDDNGVAKGSNHLGAAIHYKIADIVTLHAGYEKNTKRAVNKAGQYFDGTTYLTGFELQLPAGFGLSGGYKHTKGQSKNDDSKYAEQAQYSVVGQYWKGPWGFRLGYAKNAQSKIDGVRQNDSDEVTSAQFMYNNKGFLPYVRVGKTNAGSTTTHHYSDDMFTRVGLEFSF